MTVRRTLDLGVYRNTGTYVSPTWTLMRNIKDLSGPDSKTEGDASIRGSFIAMKEPTLQEVSFEFDMVHDPADLDFLAVEGAYEGNTTIELAMADGPIATPGTRYRRYTLKVFDWSRGENLADVATRHATLKPSFTTNAQGVLTIAV